MSKYHNADTVQVNSVIIKIKNEEAMLLYYTKALRLTVLSREDNLIHLGTKNSKKLVSLLVTPEATLSTGGIGLYHFAILLPTRKDLANFLLHYVETGYPLIGASDHNVSEAVYLEDPEGNGIEIYVDRDDSVWKKDGKLTRMDTVRLDVNNLLKEKDELGFKEMPVDTIMGHLHLHVASIKKGEEFFVDGLGFEKILFYGNSAMFTSDKGYHHHLAFNIWDVNAKATAKEVTGLFGYTLYVPENRKDAILARLTQKGFNISKVNDLSVVEDVNGSKVYITSLL